MSYAADYAAGRQAYDDRRPWRSTMPDGWRVGWIQRQQEAGVERAARERAAWRDMASKPKARAGDP